MSTPEPPAPDASGPSGQTAPVCYRHTDREAHIRCQRCERPICPDCMRPAAVGFQCPQCVKEGARSTRTGRTAYGGQRSGNPTLTSKVLIGVNVAVWLAVLATGYGSSRLAFELALNPVLVAQGSFWQVLTSAFLHIQVWHIGFNMLVLYALGPQLEGALGRTRFLTLYLLSALTASAAVMWLSAPFTFTLGASGAVFGLLGALLVIALKVGGDVRGILTWIGINFVLTLFFIGRVSWEGHLGGLVGGLVLGAVFAYAPRERRTAVQAAGAAGVAVVVLVALAARVAALS